MFHNLLTKLSVSGEQPESSLLSNNAVSQNINQAITSHETLCSSVLKLTLKMRLFPSFHPTSGCSSMCIYCRRNLC